MAEVLSQAEIDALLAAVSDGSVSTQTAAEKGAQSTKTSQDFVTYDLSSQEKVVRSRLAALEGINERFSRLFRASLTHTLRKKATVTCSNTDFIRFGDYLKNVVIPTSLNLFGMENPKGNMIVVMTSKLTYALIDAYYGGSERAFSKVGGKEEFTAIENSMIKKISALAGKDLEEAWRPNYPIRLQYLRSESNPHFVGTIHPSDTAIVSTFDVELESLSGAFVVIVQLRALDAIAQFLSVNVTGEVNTDSDTWYRHWLTELGEIGLHVKVELGHTESTLRNLQQIKVGDTILVSQEIPGEVTLLVEEIPKVRGLMGARHGNAAVRVVSKIDSKGE